MNEVVQAEEAPRKPRKYKKRKKFRDVNLTETQRAQFDAFLHDVIIPTVRRPQLQFTELYASYKRYCRALDQEPALSAHHFSQKFNTHIFRTSVKGQRVYYCSLRRDIYQEDI
jgi:phage/plasmid-associated DNA primase